MGNAIIISPLAAMILSFAAASVVTVFGWFAKGYLKRMDRDRTETLQGMDGIKAELMELLKQSDARSEGRYRETQAALRETQATLREVQAALCELSTRVSRLEGARDAKDSSTGGAEQHSPRRNDDPSAAPAGEAEPAQAAEPLDRSMVPMAGIGAEPDHAAGLAHQAVPGQKSAEESGAEPNAEESPDTAR